MNRESTERRALLPATRRPSRGLRPLALAAALCLGLGAPAPSMTQQSEPASPPPATAPRAPTVAEAEAMEARLQAAIQVNPNLASLHASLGDLYRSQARLPEARDAFVQAVRLEPMNSALRQQLGRAHLALDEFVDAEINFSWGAELAPQDPEMYAGLGEALIGLDRGPEAVAALQRAAALDPQNPEIERLLSLARSSVGASEAETPAASLMTIVARGLTLFFAVLLTIAGVGLLLPVGSAVVVLILLLPRAILRRRKA